MKRCPTCSRVYDDVSLRFCLDDGTELVNKLPEAGAPDTLVLPGSHERPQSTIEAESPIPPPATFKPPQPAAPRRSFLPWILGSVVLLMVLGAGVVSAILLLRPKQALVVHLTLQVDPAAPNRDAAVTQSVAIINSRLDALGVANFAVKAGQPGTGLIVVDLPALNNPERVKRIISSWGKLEFVHVIGPPSPSAAQTYETQDEALAAANSVGNAGSRRVLSYSERSDDDVSVQTKPGPKRWVVVASPAIVDGSELRMANAARSTAGADYEIQFSLKAAGADRFGSWTGANINQYLGIALNDEVKSIAYIKSQIFDQGVITGRFTKQSAEDLALVLNSGALPARLQFVEERIDRP